MSDYESAVSEHEAAGVPLVREVTCEKLWRIRPLEWEEFVGWRFRANVMPDIYYCVIRDYRGEFCWFSGGGMSHPCDSIEDGKRLAEAHWRERLMQALEEVGDG